MCLSGSIVDNAGAGGHARRLRAVPHAVDIAIARGCKCVAQVARSCTLPLGRAAWQERGAVHRVDPFAAVVGDAGSLVRVLVTEWSAERVPRAPRAARLGIARRLARHRVASVTALSSGRVPEASCIVVACPRGTVGLSALLDALRAGPRANRAGSPAFLLRHVLARARAHAAAVDPHAVRVVEAIDLVCVLSSARWVAGVAGRVPRAQLGGRASAGSEVRTCLPARARGGVPVALGVCVTRRCVLVLDFAGDLAARRCKEAPRNATTACLSRAVRSIPAASLVRATLSLCCSCRCTAGAVRTFGGAGTSKRVLPVALEVHAAAFGGDGKVALGHAKIGRVVPQTHVVVVARGFCEVPIRAGLEAAAAADNAEAVLEAERAAVVLLASSRADSVHGIPHAARIEVAVNGVSGHVQALHLAARCAIVELALAVGSAGSVAVVVQVALCLACRGLVVPLAVLIGLCKAIGACSAKRASAVAALSLRHRVANLRSNPNAQRVLVTFREAVYVAAVLEALVVIKDAIIVLQAGRLCVGAAVAAARYGKIRVVLAHCVAKARLLVLVRARLAAEVAGDVPHALIVGVAETLGGVAVPALLLARGVRSHGRACLGIAKHAKIARWVRALVHVNVEVLCLVDCKGDADSHGSAGDIGNRANLGAIGPDNDVEAVNACLILARCARSCRSDCGTEGVIRASEPNLGGAVGRSSWRKRHRRAPCRAVHHHVVSVEVHDTRGRPRTHGNQGCTHFVQTGI